MFASKDRLDEMPFRERAVRDGQYKYLLNYRPGETGGKPLAYREQLNTMEELHKWFEGGRMSDQQAFWFRPRPAEELYDLENDPHEVNNLVEDPRYASVLNRLREALAGWKSRVPDLSDEPEIEMAERFWPGGEQPLTVKPEITVSEGWVSIESASAGASVAFSIDGGAWVLYKGPFPVLEASAIEAKAVRYGWRESAVARWPSVLSGRSRPDVNDWPVEEVLR